MMIEFSDVQNILDTVLGDAKPGNHGAFWRGKSRDEFVASSVMGLRLISGNDPASSNLVLALRGEPPFGRDLTPRLPGAVFPRMPKGLPPAAPEAIDMIAAWIEAGCPEFKPERAGMLLVETRLPSDDDHVAFWREMDIFFHPNHSNDVTRGHVGRIHAAAYIPWSLTHISESDGSAWGDYVAQEDVVASFRYIRLHQRRLIHSFLGNQPEGVLNCLWNFGGDLLPRDPHSAIYPEHRMNGTSDWCYWLPYLHMSLVAADRNDIDLALIRGWHAGVVADGLLRKDTARDVRIAIPEYSEDDPDLKATVMDAVRRMDPDTLFTGLLARGKAIDALPEEPA